MLTPIWPLFDDLRWVSYQTYDIRTLLHYIDVYAQPCGTNDVAIEVDVDWKMSLLARRALISNERIQNGSICV